MTYGALILAYVSTRKSFRYAFESLLNAQNWEIHLILFSFFLIGYGFLVAFYIFFWAVGKIQIEAAITETLRFLFSILIALYFVTGLLLGLGLLSTNYFRRNGFPVIDLKGNPENFIVRMSKILAYNIFYTVFFWQDKVWLLSYFIYPIAILRIGYHALRLEFMFEIAMANKDLTPSECAKRSWELTEGKVREMLWLHVRLIITGLAIGSIPVVGVVLLPSMSLPIGILGVILYSIFPVLTCAALSAAKITSIREYVGKLYGHGAFSANYFFSLNNYGTTARGESQYTYYNEKTTTGRSYTGNYGRHRRRYKTRSYTGGGTYQQQYFRSIYDSSDGVWILSQLREMSLRNDYHSMLGLSSNATREQIRTGYYELAKRFHPDRHTENPLRQKLVGEIFKYINEAYSSLGA